MADARNFYRPVECNICSDIYVDRPLTRLAMAIWKALNGGICAVGKGLDHEHGTAF